MDFSDIGGVPVGGASATPASGGAKPDFSDLGAMPVAPDEGAIMAAGRGFNRNVPLLQQAEAATGIGGTGDTYAARLRDLTQKAEAAKEQHPGAYGVGAVGGTVAPLLIPGAGEALEAAPILGNAALSAANAASDVDLTNPTKRDVANVGLAALLGGGIGGATKYAFGAKGAAKAAQAAEEAAAPEAEAAADAKFIGAMTDPDTGERIPLFNILKEGHPSEGSTVSADTLRSMNLKVPDIGEVAAPPLKALNGLAIPNKTVAADFVPTGERVAASNIAQGLGGTPRQLLKIMGKDPVAELNDIGNWMSTADNGKSIVKLLDRPGELLNKTQAIHDAAGRQIGDIIDEIVGPNVPVSQGGVASEGREFLVKRLSDTANELHLIEPQSETKVLNLLDRINTLDNEGKLTFEKLQDLKSIFGRAIQKDDHMVPVYGALSDYINQTVDNFGKQIGEPSLKQAYDAAKYNYMQSSKILPILRYAEAKDLVGGPAGHQTLRGLLSTMVHLGTTMTGLPPVGQVARNALIKSAPAMRPIANAASGVGRGLGKAAQLELANALSTMYQSQGRKKP